MEYVLKSLIINWYISKSYATTKNTFDLQKSYSSSLCMWFKLRKIIRWNLTNTDTKRTFINRVPVSSGHSKNLMDAWSIEMKRKAVILKRN